MIKISDDFGTKLPPNIHTVTVQDILPRRLDPSFRKSRVAAIRSWQWPKANHQNQSSYNYLRSCWELHTNHSTDLKQKEKTACKLAENPHIYHFDLHLLMQIVCSLSDCHMRYSAQPLDQEAPEHSSKTNLHQKQVAIRPDGLLNHSVLNPGKTLRSVLRKLTRYRTTQCLWLALVKRKALS